ncbi:MAG TPA: hypothetical protein VHX38_35950 [Pseudonocardiaceae bacterium]|nr:hypothetical protein [Pseudonocardiaceae bacterium]
MTESAALLELRELIGAGGWRSLPGEPGVLIFIRAWPDDSVDTLAVSGESEALAERTNPVGDPVWRKTGALTEVIAALRGLPTPAAVTAPRTVIVGDAVDRTM